MRERLSEVLLRQTIIAAGRELSNVQETGQPDWSPERILETAGPLREVVEHALEISRLQGRLEAYQHAVGDGFAPEATPIVKRLRDKRRKEARGPYEAQYLDAIPASTLLTAVDY